MMRKSTEGRVVAVRGSVVDVAFESGAFPAILEVVTIEGDGGPIAAEVQLHLDAKTVRTVALAGTSGLRRGVTARATGAPLEVPVGEAVLGRLLDALGRPADRGEPLPEDTPRARSTASPRRSQDREGSPRSS